MIQLTEESSNKQASKQTQQTRLVEISDIYGIVSAIMKAGKLEQLELWSAV